MSIFSSTIGGNALRIPVALTRLCSAWENASAALQVFSTCHFAHKPGQTCSRFFKQFLAIFFLMAIISHSGRAQNSGIYESYAVLNINGAGNTFYDLQASTGNPDFEGANLGIFNASNTLVLNGGEHKTFRCTQDWITQTDLFYRVYRVSTTPPAFTSTNIIYNSDLGVTGSGCGGTDQNQRWQSIGAGINLLSGLSTPGQYIIEIYSTANYDVNSVPTGTRYASNGGANYKAVFTLAADCVNGISVAPAAAQNICQNLPSTMLTATITTSAGAGAATIQYEWFSNTVNSTTGPNVTSVQGPTNTTTATNTSSFTPPTNTAGQLWYFCRVTNTDATCSGSFETTPVSVTIFSQPTLSSASVTTPILCFGGTGTVTLVAVNGTAPYTYTFNGNSNQTGVFPGIPAGNNYLYSIVDANGCGNISGTLTIAQPTAITASGAVTSNYNGAQLSCNTATDGQITITASGGTGTLQFSVNGGGTYQASNVFNSLAAGSYNLAVRDANGCVQNAGSVTITAPAAITASGAVTSNYNGAQLSCNTATDGQITITASGGTGTLQFSINGGGTYQASNVFNSLAAGTYNLAVRDANGCVQNAGSVTITAPAALTMSIPTSNSPVCSGNQLNLFSSPSGGTGAYTFSWTGPNGFNASTQNPSIANAGINASGIYSLTVTDANGCIVSASTSTVTIHETPGITTATPASQTICSADNIANIAFTNSVGSSVFNWTRTTPGGITGTGGVSAASGVGTISGAFSNSTASPVTVFFSVTPVSNGCPGPTINNIATVQVNPVPTVNAISNQILCNNASTTAVAFSGNATSYSYTNNNPAIGLAAGPTVAAGIPSFTATNTGTSPISGTITVTPIYTNGGATCYGPTQFFTITVNPTPVLSSTLTPPAICSGTVFSYTPTTSATGVTTSFSWSRAAVAGISNAASSGTNNPNEILYNTTDAPITVTYVYTLSAEGCTSTQNVSVVVNPMPLVQNASVTVCSNIAANFTPASTPPSQIVPAGTTYSWGMPFAITGGMTGASTGTGQPGFSQTLLNPTNTQQTAAYTVTASAGACASAFNVIVFVNPEPTLNVAPNAAQIICSNTGITPISLSNPNGVAGTTFSWTRTNTVNITGLESGSGNSVSGNLVNLTNTDQITTFSFVATSGVGCTSPSVPVTITVKAVPAILATPASQPDVCSDQPISTITLTNPNAVAGTTYSWTRDNTANLTGIAASGSGNTISGTFTNTTNINQTTTFTITATANGCSSTTTVSITVKPKPTIAVVPLSQTVCSNSPITPIVITNPNAVSGTTYSWMRTVNINLSGIALVGTSSTISGTFANAVNSDQSTTFTLTTVANGCSSDPVNATVTVNPTPAVQVNRPTQATICHNAPIQTITISSPAPIPAIAGTTFSWSRTNNNIGGLPMSGTGNTISGTVTNITSTIQNDVITVRATAPNGCYTETTATISVYAQLVAPTISEAQTVCLMATPAPFTSTMPIGGTGSYNYQWQRSPNATGGPWTNVGSNSLTYSPPQIPFFGAQNYYYRLVVSDACGTVTSNTIWIEVVTNGTITYTPSNIPATAVCPNFSFTPQISAVHLPTSSVKFEWNANPAFLSPATGGPVGTTVYTSIFGFPIYGTSTGNIGPLTTINNTNATVTTTVTITPYVYNKAGTIFLCTGTPQTFNVTIRPTPKATYTVPNTTICNGTSAGIVVHGNVTDAVMQFAWTRNNTVDVSGAVSGNSGNITTPANTYTIVNNLTNNTGVVQVVRYTITPTSNGCPGTPITVDISVAPTVTPGTVTGNQTICSGGTPAAFTYTAATGLNLSYQWQSGTSATGPWTDIAGAIGVNYTPTGVTATTWYRRVVISTVNGVPCSVANTTPVQITVNTIDAGSITGNQTICAGGDPVAFESVDATAAGAISYQWESSIGGCGGSFTTIPGEIGPTLNVPAGLGTTTTYRRVATTLLNGNTCTATSNCVTVFVNAVAAGVISGSQAYCGSSSANTLGETTPASGSGTVTYQWQSSVVDCTSGFGNITGATGASYTVPAGLSTTTYFRRVVTSTLNGVQCVDISNCATITITTVTPGSIGANRTVCEGGDPTAFTETVAATGTGLTYQWQSSTVSPLGPWTDITGANSNEYDVPAGITTQTYYQRVVTAGGSCSVASNYVTVFINTTDEGIITGDQTICYGGDALPFGGTAPNTMPGFVTYQWQLSTTGCGGTWVNIPSSNVAFYNPPPGLTTTTSYRRLTISTLDGVPCTSVPSNCVTVTVPSGTPGMWVGSVSTDWYNCANWANGMVPNASTIVTIPVGALNDVLIDSESPFAGGADAYCQQITIDKGLAYTGAAILHVDGNLTINANGHMDMTNGGTVQMAGNWLNNRGVAGFTSGTGLVIFDGNAIQTIATNAASESFNSVTANNTSGNNNAITLNDAVNIGGILTLTNGRILTSVANLLTITNTNIAAVAGGSANSYINGPIRRYTSASVAGIYTFPVGKTAKYRPLQFTSVALTNNSSFTAEYFSSNNATPQIFPSNDAIFLGTLQGIMKDDYWQFDQSSGTTTGKVALWYQNPGVNLWRDDFPNIISSPCATCNVAVAKRSADTGPGSWAFTKADLDFDIYSPIPEAFLYTSTGYVISGTLATFSPFTIGFGYNTILGVLPIQLITFDGAVQQGNAHLKWQVASNKDLLSFEVEHSTNGQQFAKLKTVLPGSSTQYSYVHQNIPVGANYYRLLLKDKNGEQKYSKVVQLNNGAEYITVIKGLKTNPVQQNAVVNVKSAVAQNLKWKLIDMQGRTIYNGTAGLVKNENTITLTMQHIASGYYYLYLITDDGVQASLKMMKE